MKKGFLLLACLILVLSFGVGNVHAAGFGFYGSAGSGSGDFTYEGSPSFDVDTTHTGMGFVFDSNVSQDKLFNYQLNVGYDKFNIEDNSGDDLELSGLLISNAFGFGIVRTEGFRLWIGPEIRLTWVSGNLNTYDYDAFGLGLGPAIGMNFNLPGPVSLGIKAGYQVMNYAGEATSASSITTDFDIDENMFYVNFSLMFRSSGDRF